MNEWLESVRLLLQKRYGIDLGDIGVSEKAPPEQWKDESPREYVDWIAEKYALTELES